MSKLEENLINLQNKLNTLTDTNTNTSKLEEEINATEKKNWNSYTLLKQKVLKYAPE